MIFLGAEHTAPGQAFITMNYLAHSIMYSYYALTAYGKRPPKWVSMFVTTVQTLQMFAGVAVSTMVYKWKVYDNIRYIFINIKKRIKIWYTYVLGLVRTTRVVRK